MLWAITIALAAAGLALSALMGAIAQSWIAPGKLVAVTECALDGSPCRTVLDTPQARPLGPPTWALGIVWYLVLIGHVIAARAGLLPPSLLRASQLALVAVAGFNLLLGGYLIYALVRIIRLPCPLCYTGHAINTALFVALLAAAW